jgi:hypothetical protein
MVSITLDFAASDRFGDGADRLDAYRRRTIGAASDLVLEIGVGSGQNLPLYGSAAITTLIVLVRTRETAFAPLR